MPATGLPEHYFNFAAYSELEQRADVKTAILTEKESAQADVHWRYDDRASDHRRVDEQFKSLLLKFFSDTVICTELFYVHWRYDDRASDHIRVDE
ncbi:hypothetical protein Tco_0784841 [Tanacetum coccineum]